MKNKKITSPLAISLFLLCAACGVDDNESVTRIFRYVNESSVEVALVGEPNDNFDIPDSLVLQNGGFFECSDSHAAMEETRYPSFPYKIGNSDVVPVEYIPIKIYFGKTIYQTYYFNEENCDLRNPFYYGIEPLSYIKTTREEKNKKHVKTIYTYTYTFTAEDYQNAIKAQE